MWKAIIDLALIEAYISIFIFITRWIIFLIVCIHQFFNQEDCLIIICVWIIVMNFVLIDSFKYLNSKTMMVEGENRKLQFRVIKWKISIGGDGY